MLDSIIIGAGPAGMAAAVYMARQKLDFLVISKNIGGQTLLSWEVGNYLGFQLLSGEDLVRQFKAHMEEYKIKVQQSEEVRLVQKLKKGFRVITDQNQYDTLSVLVATGERHRKLGVPGEDKYYGKGVTYCATCDAPLFGGKTVAVIGGGNSALESALFAKKYAKKVYIINIAKKLTGETGLVERVKKDKTIKIINSAETLEILGNKFVNAIKYKQVGKSKKLAVQGIFIEIGLMPVADFIGIVKKDKWRQIVVDQDNATNVRGIWAAGDVTNVTEKQIAVAVGEGSKAALKIIKYIDKIK